MENNTSIVIDLAGRYAAAFGIVKASEMMSAAVLTKEDNKYQVEFFEDFDEDTEHVIFRYDEQSLVFGGMLLDAGKAFAMPGNPIPITLPNAVFAPPLMMEFRREKDLVITETNGEDNVIIERWSTKPWEITFNGILIDVENRQYPTDQVRKLHRLFKHNNVIEVVGVLFEEKDIDTIYLKDISINPMEGFADTVQFSLTASSIKEVNWSLLKPNS